MNEWQELGVLLAIHRHAHSIKRDPPPIVKPRASRTKDARLMRRNIRIAKAEFARSLKAAA